MTNNDLARMLGIRISHTTQSADGEYWTLEPPISIRSNPFSKQGPTEYSFTTKDEVQAFLLGYSLVVRHILHTEHTPV